MDKPELQATEDQECQSESTSSKNELYLYETQHFGFTPVTLVNGSMIAFMSFLVLLITMLYFRLGKKEINSSLYFVVPRS